MGMRWFKDNIFNLLGLIPLVVAAVVAFLGWLQHVSWYLIALGVIIAICVVFLGINQVSLFRERHKKPFSKCSDKEIKDTIRKWVDIPEYTYRRSDVEVNGACFIFDLTDSIGRPIHITYNKNDPHRIGIWADLKLLPATDNEYPELPKRRLEEVKQAMGRHYDNLKRKLSLEMLRLGCNYSFYDELRLIRLANHVYIDDLLNASEFINQCLFITRAMTLVQLIYMTALNEIESDVKTPVKKDPKSSV